VTLTLLALGGIIALRMTRSRVTAAPAEDPLVPTTKVTRGSLELGVHAIGELRASKSANLVAPSVGGTLRILTLLDAGDSVKAATSSPNSIHEQQYASSSAIVARGGGASRSSRRKPTSMCSPPPTRWIS